jgi:hypothetical protein
MTEAFYEIEVDKKLTENDIKKSFRLTNKKLFLSSLRAPKYVFVRFEEIEGSERKKAIYKKK